MFKLNKDPLRILFKNKRKSFFGTTPPQIINHCYEDQAKLLHQLLFLQQFPHEPIILALYHPIRTEVDCFRSISLLDKSKYKLALPCVEESRILTFRTFTSRDKLVKGKWNIMEPDAHEEIVEPDILLVPMLAFDQNLHRLGYGKGYYDNTISALKGRKDLLAIGIAFEIQKHEDTHLPIDERDVRLDYVVTEKMIYQATK